MTHADIGRLQWYLEFKNRDVALAYLVDALMVGWFGIGSVALVDNNV